MESENTSFITCRSDWQAASSPKSTSVKIVYKSSKLLHHPKQRLSPNQEPLRNQMLKILSTSMKFYDSQNLKLQNNSLF